MSTPATIPVFDPQGVLRDIPEDQLQAAVKAGGKAAVKFQAPDKSIRYVPADRTQDAVKSGGKLLPYEQQEIKHPGFWHGLASDLVGIAEGIPSAVSGISPMALPGKIAEMSTDIAAGDIARRNEGRNAAYRIASPIVQNVTGANVRGMEESANEGDVGGVLGHAAAVPTALGIAAGAPKALEVSKGPMTQAVRTAVRASNVALEKYPKIVGSGVGGLIGAASHVPYGTEIGAGIGATLGPEILPKIKLPGEGFGLPNRVEGGPAIAPKYEPGAVYPGAPFPERPPVYPGAPLPEAPPPELLQGNALLRGPQSVIDPAAGLGRIPVSAIATKQAIQELGPQASIPSIKARAAEIQSALNEAVGYKPPEPGKPIYQRSTAAKASPGATEVQSTTRSARGLAGGGASELPEPQPRTPTPPAESTAVDSFRYNPAEQEIHITGKNGRTYVYGEVTPEQAQMFKEAESKGMAWKAIKDNNPYVAKIINGKRLSIKKAVTTASPDDLTPQLEESLRQIKESQTPTTWREYTAQNMSQAMKETGSHGAAMKKMSADWKALQSKQ